MIYSNLSSILDFWPESGYNLHNLNAVPDQFNRVKARYHHGLTQGNTSDTGKTIIDLSPFPFSRWTGAANISFFPLPVDSGERFFFDIEKPNRSAGQETAFFAR